MRRLGATVLAAMLAAAWAGSPAEASHLGGYDETVRCATHAVRDAQIVEQSTEAVAFRKLKETNGRVLPVSYACAYRRGDSNRSVRQLDHPARSRWAEGARLAGPWVAYRLVDRSNASIPSSVFEVVNLRFGGTWSYFPKPDDADTAVDVVSFVLKRNGSVAWISVGYPTEEQGVWKDDSSFDLLDDDDLPRLDASPPPIDTHSLRLSSDRRRVLWRRAGESAYRSAPLP
jgi:hypothetical protein